MERDQHSAQVDQRFVCRGVQLQRLAEALLGQREAVRLIGDGAQIVPCGGELRGQFHGVLQMFLGGFHVVLFQIALCVHVVAQRALGDFEFARRNGVTAAVDGRVEIGVLQRDGELHAIVRIRQAGPHFDGLARLAASGFVDRHGVSRRRKFLEDEAPALIGESVRGEGLGNAEQSDRRVSFGGDAARKLV